MTFDTRVPGLEPSEHDRAGTTRRRVLRAEFAGCRFITDRATGSSVQGFAETLDDIAVHEGCKEILGVTRPAIDLEPT
jgi:hypothetical protein